MITTIAENSPLQFVLNDVVNVDSNAGTVNFSLVISTSDAQYYSFQLLRKAKTAAVIIPGRAIGKITFTHVWK